MPVPTIDTARLRLRRFRSEDLDALAAVYSDPEVMRYMRSGRPLSRDQTERSLAWLIGSWNDHPFGLWAVEHPAGARLIGQCGLLHLDNTPEVEVAYLLDRPYWGAGLATEAAQAAVRYGFEEAALARIVAVARPENAASRRVLEKVGLRFVHPARYYDLAVVYYALDRSAWQPAATPYALQWVP